MRPIATWVVLATIALIHEPARACSSDGSPRGVAAAAPDVFTWFEQADAVAVVEVTASPGFTNEGHGLPGTVTLAVHDVLEGKLPAKLELVQPATPCDGRRQGARELGFFDAKQHPIGFAGLAFRPALDAWQAARTPAARDKLLHELAAARDPAIAGAATKRLAAIAPRPCPKDLGKRLAPLYGDRGGPIDVEIAACAWGDFAGPGWMVEHVLPKPPDSRSDVGPDGGEAFVTADGTIAASNQQEGNEHVQLRVVDLDGDGVDEAVMVVQWADVMSPMSGERLYVLRVDGHDIASVTADVSRDACKGSVDYVRAGAETHIAITGKGKACGDSAGRHVFVYKAHALAELPAK